ncbi:hypothetical protein M513_11034 [Trichuris suis]|nr:hypothetical protein M513_11034 [Trichuris suis]
MVERMHRQLKAAIMCHRKSDWLQVLPWVLLGMRATVRQDLQASVAELVYGTTLRLPGQLIAEQDNMHEPIPFLHHLRHVIAKARPVTPDHHAKVQVFIPKDLSRCSHVFVRHDAIRRPLTPPYDGPHAVLDRQDKFYTIRINDTQKTVSIDRLKPAFIEHDIGSPTSPQNQMVTLFGRQITLPIRYRS